MPHLLIFVLLATVVLYSSLPTILSAVSDFFGQSLFCLIQTLQTTISSDRC